MTKFLFFAVIHQNVFCFNMMRSNTHFFFNINRNCLSIFIKFFFVMINNMSVRKHQVSVSSVFALIEYKILDWTYQKTVLDLFQQSQAHENNVKHQQYCFFNVQVSHLQLKENVQLLQSLIFCDINYQIHSQFCEKNCQLKHLTNFTIQLKINSSNW